MYMNSTQAGPEAIAAAVCHLVTHKPLRILPRIPLSRQAMDAIPDTGRVIEDYTGFRCCSQPRTFPLYGNRKASRTYWYVQEMPRFEWCSLSGFLSDASDES